MKKLFSTQFGSRLYGTQTPTSDVDLKHVVLPDLNDLLLCKRIENKVKKTNTAKNTRNTVDDVDEEFIPIQVFARDFMNGQTYAIELAFAIDGRHANQTFWDNDEKSALYEKLFLVDEGTPHPFAVFTWELREKFLTSNIKAMMGYVVNQASLYSFKGERLNAVRAVRKVLEELILADHDAEPTERMSEHAKDTRFVDIAVMYPKYFRHEYYDIGDGVMKPCFKLLEKTLPHTDRVSHALTVVRALEQKYGSRADQASETNVDWKATMHAMRIVDEGIDILRDHKLSFPFEQGYVDYLLSMKRGELPLDPIKQELSVKLDLLKNLEKLTTLPALSPELNAEFEAWLVGWMRLFYNLGS